MRVDTITNINVRYEDITRLKRNMWVIVIIMVAWVMGMMLWRVTRKK